MSDLPDFWANRYVNVVAQDLGELINRPKYGAAARKQGVRNTLAGDSVLLCEVSGKGVTYGGYVKCQPAMSHADDYIYFMIDGTSLIGGTFKGLSDLGIHSAGDNLFFVTLYDETNFNYSMSWAAGITFETSLKAYYFNMTVENRLVTYWLYYALI